MLLPGDTVLVALSGGADSVALLHVMLQFKTTLALENVVALHVNHQLRGEESDRDEAFVRDLCSAWQVPLTVVRQNVALLAKKYGKGTEETGRDIRYAILEEAAEKIGPTCRIATAHTLSDNMETVLLHLCRGSGLHGLTGIPPVRGRIIRPLLHCTREEIENYCRMYTLSFVNDTTNNDPQFARNRVRSCIVPELYKINPQADIAMDRMIRQVTEADQFIRELATDILKRAEAGEGRYCRTVLAGQHRAVKTAALYQAARLMGASPEERHVEKLVKLLTDKGGCTLPGNIQARTIGEHLVFMKVAPAKETNFTVLMITPGQKYSICDRKFQFLLCSLEEVEKGQFVHKKYLKNALDYDKLCGRLTIRSRQPGDAYHPAGRRAGKSLKKLFNEAHLSCETRKKIPIFWDEHGIVLVPGFGCDQRVKPDAETKRLLIYYEDKEEKCDKTCTERMESAGGIQRGDADTFHGR